VGYMSKVYLVPVTFYCYSNYLCNVVFVQVSVECQRLQGTHL